MRDLLCFSDLNIHVQLAIGAAIGTAKAGIGIAGLGTFKPELIMRASTESSDCFCSLNLRVQSLIPVVMSGIIAVYGLVVSVLISGGREFFLTPCIVPLAQTFLTVKPGDYSLFAGFVHLGAGLACGLTGLSAGYAIGIVGDSVSFCLTLGCHAQCMLVVCARLSQRVKNLCHHGAYSYFRRSTRTLRVSNATH